MTEHALLCQNVTKIFGDVPAVRNLTLGLAPGDFHALLGPSGCGKTTSLRLIAGLEAPTSGSISLHGRPVAGQDVWVAPHKRRVGLVFQDYALFPHMDVGRNIAYGLSGSRAQNQARVAEVLTLVGLTGLEHRMPHELSGGQQQRVALARALAPEPTLLLLDEPFSNLDASLRWQVREDVRRIVKDTGVTTVLVTHDQAEAFSLADQVSVMLEGAIQQTADPATLYTQPATPQIARFVGEANLLPGQAHGPVVDCSLGQLPLQAPHDGPVEVLIRPEDVQLALADEAPNAEVVAISYFGHDQLITLRLDGATQPLQARADNQLAVQRGQRVRASVQGPVRAFAVSSS